MAPTVLVVVVVALFYAAPMLPRFADWAIRGRTDREA
jgi:hypothetical protein